MGFTAFVTDLFARSILGWQAADNLRSDLALDALEKGDLGTSARDHCRNGTPFRPAVSSTLPIRYTQRLAGSRSGPTGGEKKRLR
jgi:hypothetical protein